MCKFTHIIVSNFRTNYYRCKFAYAIKFSSCMFLLGKFLLEFSKQMNRATLYHFALKNSIKKELSCKKRI